MRSSTTMTAIRAQLAMMVHPSVQPRVQDRMRHERFMLTRLAVSSAGLSLVPGYLAWRGELGHFELLALMALALPLLAVFLLSRTGRLDFAHALSSAALTLAVMALAGVTGGLTSPVLFLLALVPAEAAFFGARSYVLRATALAGLGLAAVVLQGSVHLGADTPWHAVMMPGLVLVALLVALAFAFALVGERQEMRRDDRAMDVCAQLMLDNVGDLVTWHDAGGAVVFANQAARALAGAEPGHLHGRGLFERVHIADRPLYLKALSDALHSAGAVRASFRVLFVPVVGAGQDAGRPVVRWLEMNARRVGAHGSSGGAAVVCVTRDVTDRLARDEERERDHAEAVKVNDVKGQFLATVSHELRTPLNAIIGFSEILSGELAPTLGADKRQDYARIIHESGHHLLEVVNTLLDVSKIESGAMTIEQDRLDIAALADDCCTLVALKAQAGQVALERVVGPELPLPLGDRRALKQVLLNLLSNAIKFTPPGGRVTLAVVRDGGMIDLSVSDTGIGIAAADLPRLGDPFFQAKAAFDRSHDGTGLGLSVVRGLVGLHGGTLTIESAPGLGTRVAVRLPIAGVGTACEPVRIATYARAPRRGLETKQPVRLTA